MLEEDDEWVPMMGGAITVLPEGICGVVVWCPHVLPMGSEKIHVGREGGGVVVGTSQQVTDHANSVDVEV